MRTCLTFSKVNVSALTPPEPMMVILNHLSRLTPKECLLIKHRRQPFPLYEKLASAGFSYHCVVHTQDNITLYVFHQSAQAIFDEWLLTNDITKIDLIKGKIIEY